MLSDGLKYQDSRMATCEEMKQDLAPFALHDAAAKSKGGPVLLRDGDTVYTDPSDSHSLIVGDTGSMKTLRFVLPLIYSCAAASCSSRSRLAVCICSASHADIWTAFISGANRS